MGGFSSKPTSSTKARPPPPTISSVDRAVLDLKVARDRLQRYRTQLEGDQEKLKAQALKAKQAGKTQRALGLLRLKQYKTQQAQTCEDQLLNVLQMVDTIDSKQNEQQMLQALKAGKDTLQKMHQETTVEDVLTLMEDIQEEVQVEQEINQILKDNVPELSPADELVIEAELEALMMGETKLPEVPTTKLPETQLPTVPTKKPTATTTAQKQPERVAVPG